MENFFGQEEIPERVMLLEDPRDAFRHRINLISKAEKQILLSTFHFAEGKSADIITGALLSAAERGVNVKVLNNGFVGTMPPRYIRVLSAHENINIYLFNRFEFFRPRYINAALHDKYLIIDESFMILGGRNIGDKYFNPEGYTGKLSLDREVLVFNTDLYFQGSIADVSSYFEEKINSDRAAPVARRTRNDWEERKNHYIGLYMEWRESFHQNDFDFYSNTVGVNRITLITNPFDTAKKESVLAYKLMMIAKNSNVIIAQSPYVVLTRRNLEIFATLVRYRDFTLLTNSLASTPNLPSFSAYYVNRRNILATGITIYEYQSTESSLHAKTYLFDGRLTAIGSFNMNERSIRSDTESMLIIDSEEFHDITLEAVNRFIARSLRVNADNTYELSDYARPARVSRGKRILYNVAGRVLRMFRFMF